jgi:hypothetical protein
MAVPLLTNMVFPPCFQVSSAQDVDTCEALWRAQAVNHEQSDVFSPSFRWAVSDDLEVIPSIATTQLPIK